jgi:hypothetical protein
MNLLRPLKYYSDLVFALVILAIPYVGINIAIVNNRTPDGPKDPELDAQLWAHWHDYSETLARRAAFKRPRPSGLEWERRKLKVKARDRFTCFYCGKRTLDLHIDHYYPHSKGGSDSMINLVASCSECNRKKRAKMPRQWFKEISHF